MNTSLDNSQEELFQQKLPLQRRNTTNGGGILSSGSSQIQKFSFGNMNGLQGEDDRIDHTAFTIKDRTDMTNPLREVMVSSHPVPQPQVHRPATATASVYCNSARNPTSTTSSRVGATTTTASCLQAFTQRHLEASQAISGGGTGLPGKPNGRNGHLGATMMPVASNQVGSLREEGTSVTNSHEGNILTFRGSRQFNESSNRDSMQTDRHGLQQQTTFGNIATARGGKPSPGTTGSADIPSHALIGSAHPNLVQTQQLILSTGKGVAGLSSSYHQKIQSENGGMLPDGNLGRVTAAGSLSESTQLRVSCGGEAGGTAGDSMGPQALTKMAKYLEDHTRGHEISGGEDSQAVMKDISERINTKEQRQGYSNHNQVHEGPENSLPQSWKKQHEGVSLQSKQSSVNTTYRNFNDDPSSSKQPKYSSQGIGNSRASSSQAANQSVLLNNQTHQFDQGIEQPRQYDTERQLYPMRGAALSSNLLNKDLQLCTDIGSGNGQRKVGLPWPQGGGFTPQNKNGPSNASKATTNSMISYYYSNRSNAATQKNNQDNTGDRSSRTQGLTDQFAALEPRSSDQQHRLDTFIIHPTQTTATVMTTHRNSLVSTSLADGGRGRHQLNQGTTSENTANQTLDPHQESGRPRLIETVQEQDESSTNSNKRRANPEQSTSTQFDYSSQNQQFKATETHNLCPWPSPFVQGGLNNNQLQKPQIVIDSENVGKEIPIPLPNMQTSPLQNFTQKQLQGQLQHNLSPLLSLSALQRAAETIQPMNPQIKPVGIIPTRQDEENVSQSRNCFTSQPVSHITSQMDSQDFNEFNTNETKSEAKNEGQETNHEQYEPGAPLSERADVDLNHLDIVADMPFTERICRDHRIQQPPQSQTYYHDADNFGSSVPNAFRKVVFQPDSMGPKATSSCVTENNLKYPTLNSTHRKDYDLGSSDGPYTFYKGEREQEGHDGPGQHGDAINQLTYQNAQNFHPATFARPSDQFVQDGTKFLNQQNPCELEAQLLFQQQQNPRSHHKTATSGNHQGGSISQSVANEESTESEQVYQGSSHFNQHQNPQGAFLQRSYLKNISAQDEKESQAEQITKHNLKDYLRQPSQANNHDDETQISVENVADGDGMGGLHLQIREYQNGKGVPQNQNAILYDGTCDENAPGFSQNPQTNPNQNHVTSSNYNQKQVYCNSHGSSNKRVMIERSPLNEKMLIEELINNGYANHDGSQAKNHPRIVNSNGVAQRALSDHSMNRDLVLKSCEGLVTQTSPQQFLNSDYHNGQPSTSKPQSRAIQLNNQLTNTLPTTDGNAQDDLSERLPSQIQAEEECQMTQNGPQEQSNKEHSTMAEVAEEMNYYQVRDLPERGDANLMEMVMQRQQQQFEQHQAQYQRYHQLCQEGENKQHSIRDMLDLPKEANNACQPIKTENLVTVVGSQINSPFCLPPQQSRSKETQNTTPAHGSFDVRRKEKSELQASPSRVMDDQQPEYNSRLDHQVKDPCRVLQSQQQLSFDQREQNKMGQRGGIRILIAEETVGQECKQDYDIAQNFKLVYTVMEYNDTQQVDKQNIGRMVYETFKIVNPLKPKSWTLTLSRISSCPTSLLRPTVTKLHTSFSARLSSQPFPQTPLQRAQITHDLTRILTQCSSSLPFESTILVTSKLFKKANDSVKTQAPLASTHRSILDAYTGLAPPGRSTQQSKKLAARSTSSRPKSQKEARPGGGSGWRRTEEGSKARGGKAKRTTRQKVVSPEQVMKSVEERDKGKGFLKARQRGSHAVNAVGGGPSLQTSSEKRLNYLKLQGSLSNQGSCESDNNCHSVVNKMKSPSDLFDELALFKERNDEKLMSKSKDQDSLVKSKSCLNTKRFSTTQANEHLFFDNFSRGKQKLDTSSKSIKINLKNLAEQSNIQLFNNRNQSSVENTSSPKSVDQRHELIKRLDQRSRSNQVTGANMPVSGQQQTRNSGTAISKTAKRTEPSNNSIRNLSQRSEKLYQDHFHRQSRLRIMQEKCVRFQAQQNLTERSLPTQKSNQILANKIALAVKTEYDKIIDEIRSDLLNKHLLDKIKRTDMVIEEKSGESGEKNTAGKNGSRPTGRSAGTTTRAGERSEGCDQLELEDQETEFRPQIEGVDLQRFVQLLSRLHYLSDVSDQRVILQERMAIRNAWQLISHRDWAMSEQSSYSSDTPIANLRNLLIFLIGIENIFVESMANCQQLEEAHMQELMASKSNNSNTHSSANIAQSCRQYRQIGFFIGQNYFLEGEQDCLKLMQAFNLLVQNKLCYQRERQRLLTRAKLQALQQSENLNGGSFYPAINKKSEQIMSEKSQGALYTRTSQSKAESLERKESLYQHTVGYASSARGTDHLASQKLSKESSTRLKKVGCKYEDFLISKAAQRKIKLEKMAKQATKDETKECTFTPQINKSNSTGFRRVGARAKSREAKSKQNKENVAAINQNNICVQSNNVIATSQNQDVFENLYRFAEVRREKSEDGKRTAQVHEKKLLKKQCPFKPNLSKTQKINKSVNSKIYQYKEPDLSPFHIKDPITFQNTQKSGFHTGAMTMAMISSRKQGSTPKGVNGQAIQKGLNTTREQAGQLKGCGNGQAMNPYGVGVNQQPQTDTVLSEGPCMDPFSARSPHPYDALSTTNLLLPSPMTMENYQYALEDGQGVGGPLLSPRGNNHQADL